MLSRIIYGARTSLSVSVTAIAISVLLGMALGAAAGYFGGVFDRAVTAVVDLTWSFPEILIALMLVAIIGPGLHSTMFAIAHRLSRAVHPPDARADHAAEERDLSSRRPSTSAPATRHILFRHLLPNALAPVIVVGMLATGDAIILEATLGFFGLGAQPPTPSWGAMMSSGTAQIFIAPWIIIFPGLVVAVTVDRHQSVRRRADRGARYPRRLRERMSACLLQVDDLGVTIGKRRAAVGHVVLGSTGARSSASSANPARASR